MAKKSSGKKRVPIKACLPGTRKTEITNDLRNDLHLGAMALSYEPTFDSYYKIGIVFLVIINTTVSYPHVLSDEAVEILNEGLLTLDEINKHNLDKEKWEVNEETIKKLKSTIAIADPCISLFSYSQLKQGYTRTINEVKQAAKQYQLNN